MESGIRVLIAIQMRQTMQCSPVPLPATLKVQRTINIPESAVTLITVQPVTIAIPEVMAGK